jgi:hypothetical protein
MGDPIRDLIVSCLVDHGEDSDTILELRIGPNSIKLGCKVKIIILMNIYSDHLATDVRLLTRYLQKLNMAWEIENWKNK